MPWDIQSAGNGKYNVRSQKSGKVVGHNLSKKRAKAMMRALYANVPDATTNANGYPKGVDMKVAKKVDLIVLPVSGTNCGNCKFVNKGKDGMYCDNPKVKQPVTTHLCCFLPTNKVRPEGRWEGASKAFYSGPAVEIITARGKRLSLTVNHPVLTEDGFIAAGQLRKGLNLIADGNNIESAFAVDDIKNTPITAEQVFHSLSSLDNIIFSQIKPTAMDFHGDATLFKGDVDVIRTNSQLMDGRQSPEFKLGDDFQLSESYSGFDALESLCPSKFFMFGNRLTLLDPSSSFGLLGSQFGVVSDFFPDSLVTIFAAPTNTANRFGTNSKRGKAVVHNCLSNALVSFIPCLFDNSTHLHAEQLSFLDGFLASSDLLTFCSCSKNNAVGEKEFFDLVAVSTKTRSNKINSLSVDVSFDQVVDVCFFHYDGPVYDFQTTTGLIVACGIKVSNCALWDNDKVKRPWGKEAVTVNEKQRRIQTRKKFVKQLLAAGHPPEDCEALQNMSLNALALMLQSYEAAGARSHD